MTDHMLTKAQMISYIQVGKFVPESNWTYRSLRKQNRKRIIPLYVQTIRMFDKQACKRRYMRQQRKHDRLKTCLRQIRKIGHHLQKTTGYKHYNRIAWKNACLACQVDKTVMHEYVDNVLFRSPSLQFWQENNSTYSLHCPNCNVPTVFCETHYRMVFELYRATQKSKICLCGGQDTSKAAALVAQNAASIATKIANQLRMNISSYMEFVIRGRRQIQLLIKTCNTVTRVRLIEKYHYLEACVTRKRQGCVITVQSQRIIAYFDDLDRRDITESGRLTIGQNTVTIREEDARASDSCDSDADPVYAVHVSPCVMQPAKRYLMDNDIIILYGFKVRPS